MTLHDRYRFADALHTQTRIDDTITVRHIATESNPAHCSLTTRPRCSPRWQP